MLKAAYAPYTLQFNFDARTSRGSMTNKPTFFVKVWDESAPERVGYGECGVFPGLSPEWSSDYQRHLAQACRQPEAVAYSDDYPHSSILFGLQTAITDLRGDFAGSRWLDGEYGLPTNGLVWMGDYEQMLARIQQKIADGFKCLKLKIGGIDFEAEVSLIEGIRAHFGPSELKIRLDANGSFAPINAMPRLERLARYAIDSIEQPIRAGQWQQMRALCAGTPIDIMLDEELIGRRTAQQREALLEAINPQGIILKPTLCGGYVDVLAWQRLAQQRGLRVWYTSALESNVGLRAIGVLVDGLGDPSLPQGLGTGQLFTNNIPSGLALRGQNLYNDPQVPIDLSQLTWIEP